jgi:hypothetical protein
MSVIIQTNTYFTGPLYTSSINSYSNITIINNLNYMAINTNNASCNNLSINNLYTNQIKTINNVLTLNKPYNYVNTNFTPIQNISSLGDGIITQYNISNTNGYINAMWLKGGVVPIGSTYSFNNQYNVTAPSSLTKMGTITIQEPGIYLMYTTLQMYIETTDTNKHLTNIYSQITVNNTIYAGPTEINVIKNYVNPAGGVNMWYNGTYHYTKMWLIQISLTNSSVDWFFNPNPSNVPAYSTLFRYYTGLNDGTFIPWVNIYSIKIA